MPGEAGSAGTDAGTSEHTAGSTQQAEGQSLGRMNTSARILSRLHVRGGEEDGNPGCDADNPHPVP